MKAMKEKRISLRSLARRGLVILSVLALVFAVACGGNDGDNTTPTTDPTDSSDVTDPTDPPPPAKIAQYLKVIKEPTGRSHEGLPADLTGLEVEVVFSDGSYAYITDSTQFATTPHILGFAEKSTAGASVGTDATPTALNLYHLSNSAVSQGISVVVIPLTGVHVTGTAAKQAYFEDDYPDFAGITVEGIYADFIDDEEIAEHKVSIPLNYAYLDEITSSYNGGTNNRKYPGIDPVSKMVTVVISKGNTVSTASYPAPTGTPTDAKVSWSFTDFYDVRYVEINNTDSLNWNEYFEDDEDKSSAEWAQELVDAGVELRVHYMGTDETKIRTMSEYQRAVALGNAEMVKAPDFKLLSTDAEMVVAGLGYYQGTKYPNETVNVQVPVAEFQDEVRFDRKNLTTTEPVQIIGRPTAYTDGDCALTADEVAAIKANYNLNGIYSLNGVEKVKSINTLWDEEWWGDAVNHDIVELVNDASDGEIEEVDITLTVPSTITTGTGDWFLRYQACTADLTVELLVDR